MALALDAFVQRAEAEALGATVTRFDMPAPPTRKDGGSLRFIKSPPSGGCGMGNCGCSPGLWVSAFIGGKGACAAFGTLDGQPIDGSRRGHARWTEKEAAAWRTLARRSFGICAALGSVTIKPARAFGRPGDTMERRLAYCAPCEPGGLSAPERCLSDNHARPRLPESIRQGFDSTGLVRGERLFFDLLDGPFSLRNANDERHLRADDKPRAYAVRALLLEGVARGWLRQLLTCTCGHDESHHALRSNHDGSIPYYDPCNYKRPGAACACSGFNRLRPGQLVSAGTVSGLGVDLGRRGFTLLRPPCSRRCCSQCREHTRAAERHFIGLAVVCNHEPRLDGTGQPVSHWRENGGDAQECRKCRGLFVPRTVPA